MVRHLKAGNCLKIGNWSVLVFFGWHFVIVMRWEGREPFHSHAITPLGNNKAAFSPTLRFAKVSSTKESARVYSVSPPGHLINDVVLGYSDLASFFTAGSTGPHSTSTSPFQLPPKSRCVASGNRIYIGILLFSQRSRTYYARTTSDAQAPTATV